MQILGLSHCFRYKHIPIKFYGILWALARMQRRVTVSPAPLCIYHKQFHSVKFYAMNSDEKVFIKCVNSVDNMQILVCNVRKTG